MADETGNTCTWGVDCSSSPFDQITAIDQISDYFDISVQASVGGTGTIFFTADLSSIGGTTAVAQLDVNFCLISFSSPSQSNAITIPYDSGSSNTYASIYQLPVFTLNCDIGTISDFSQYTITMADETGNTCTWGVDCSSSPFDQITAIDQTADYFDISASVSVAGAGTIFFTADLSGFGGTTATAELDVNFCPYDGTHPGFFTANEDFTLDLYAYTNDDVTVHLFQSNKDQTSTYCGGDYGPVDVRFYRNRALDYPTAGATTNLNSGVAEITATTYYYTIHISQLSDGLTSFTIQRERFFESISYANFNTRYPITIRTGTLNIVKCILAEYSGTTVISEGGVTYTDFAILQAAGASIALTYLWPAPHASADCPLTNTVTNDLSLSTDPDAPATLSIDQAVAGTVTLESTWPDGTVHGPSRTGNVVVCGYDYQTSSLFSDGDGVDIEVYYFGPMSKTVDIFAVESIAEQASNTLCEIDHTLWVNGVEIGVTTAADQFYISSAYTMEINNMLTSQDTDVYNLEYKPILRSSGELIATKTGSVTYRACTTYTASQPGQVFENYLDLDYYMGRYATGTDAQPLITLTSNQPGTPCESDLTYSISHDAPTTTIVQEDLPNELNFVFGINSQTHTITLSYSILLDGNEVYSATALVNLNRCVWPEETTPSLTDLTNAVTLMQSSTYVADMPTVTWTDPNCAITNFSLTYHWHTDGIEVTHDGDDLVFNTFSDLGFGTTTITVRAKMGQTLDPDRTMVAFDKYVRVNTFNCLDSSSVIAIKADDLKHFARVTTSTCQWGTEEVGPADSQYTMRFEAGVTWKCADNQIVGLQTYSVIDDICGPLSSSISTSPALDSTYQVTYDEVTQQISLNLDAINPSSPTLTFTITLTATVPSGAFDTVELVLQVFRCLPTGNIPQPNFYYLKNTMQDQEMTGFTEDPSIGPQCLDYGFQFDGIWVAETPWVDKISTVTNGVMNTHFKIIYSADLPVGLITANRNMRGVASTFYLIICEVTEPVIPILTVDPSVYNIVNSQTTTQYVTVESYVMYPLDHASQVVNCPAMATTMTTDQGIPSLPINGIVENDDYTSTAEFPLAWDEISGIKDWTYDISIATDSWSHSVPFQLSFCKKPDLGSVVITLYESVETLSPFEYLLNIGQTDIFALSDILNLGPDACQTTYSLATDPPEYISWVAIDAATLSLQLIADNTMTHDHFEIFSATLTLTNSAGSTSAPVTIVVRDCQYEVLNADPFLEDEYVLLGDSQTVSLMADSWQIGVDSDPLCADYYFGLEITRDSDGQVNTVGGIADDISDSPIWLINWMQTTNAPSGSAHFSFEIMPMSLADLHTYTVKIQIFNSFGAVHDTAQFKIYLFQIQFGEAMVQSVGDTVETVPDYFKTPLQTFFVDSNPVDPLIKVTSEFIDLQNVAAPDVYLKLVPYATSGSDLFEDFFDIDHYDTPALHYFNRWDTLHGTVAWTSKVIDISFRFDLVDSSGAWIYKSDGVTQVTLPFFTKSIQVEIVDCEASTVVLAPGPDYLQFLTVAGLDNNRVVEDASENFSFVTWSGDGFQIKIPPSTATLTEICGNWANVVDFSAPGTFLEATFDAVDTITVYTDTDVTQTVSVTVLVQNSYYSQELIVSTFIWLDCAIETPVTGALAGTTPLTIFDYRTIASTETAEMTWSSAAFAEPACLVNAWKVECTGPDKVAYSIDSLGNTSGGGLCSRFTSHLYLDGAVVDTVGLAVSSYTEFSFADLAARGYLVSGSASILKIAGSSDSFSSADEGEYMFTMTAWMQINASRASFTVSEPIQRDIQAACDTPSNLITVKPTIVTPFTTIVHKIQEASEYNWGTEMPFEITYAKSCTYTLSILDDNGTSYGFVYTDEFAFSIVVDGTVNSDYPLDAVAPIKPTMLKTYYLRGSISSTIYNDIQFTVEYTLNCHETVISVAESEQFVTQTFIQSPNVIGEIALEKVTVADQVQNGYCDFLFENYSIYQRGFNDTSLNPGHIAGDGDYDSTLIGMLEESLDQAQILMKFQSHLITTELDGSPKMTLKTYDPDTGTVCDLEDINTLSCTQEFEIYVSSYTGVVARIATVTVTFMTECAEVGNKIASGETPQADIWTWDSVDMTAFTAGYNIRRPSITITLPSFSPTLPSGRNLFDVCGQMSFSISNPDVFGNNVHDPPDEADFMSLFTNFGPIGPTPTMIIVLRLQTMTTKPKFDVYSTDPYKTTVVAPYTTYYSFTIQASFELYPDMSGSYPDALDFPVQDECMSADFTKLQYIYKVDSTGNHVVVPTDMTIQHGVLTEPAIHLLYLNDQVSSGDGSLISHDLCGVTLYKNYWLDEEGQHVSETAITPDYERLLEIVTDDEDYNSEDGLQPLAFRSYAPFNEQIGVYRMGIEARLSLVNVDEIVFYREITVNITACQTTSVSVPLHSLQAISIYAQKTQVLQIPEFLQEPACNFTWTYEAYVNDASSSPSSYSDITALRTSAQPSPSMISSSQSVVPKAELLAQTLAFVGKTYNLYFAGTLDYYLSDDPCCEGQERVFAISDPIAVSIDLPLYMLRNTKPVISFDPPEVNLAVGQSKTISLKENLDPEGNRAWLNSFFVKSAGGEDYSKYITLSNSTDINEIQIAIELADDIAPGSASIELVFKDDHAEEPGTVNQKILVTISAPEEVEEAVFTDFDPNSGRSGNLREEEKLPPPTVKTSKMDKKGRFKVSFDQKIVINPDVLEEETEEEEVQRRLRHLQVDELSSFNSENDGSKIFQIEYKPSDKSLDLQEADNVEVKPKWKIQPIDEKSFYITVDFSNKAYVSQSSGNLDSIKMTFLRPQFFTNTQGEAMDMPKAKTTTLKVPTIVEPEYTSVQTVSILQDSFAATVKTVMAGNFVLSLILATALQYLWGMINAMQIIVLGVLFDTAQPPNARVIQFEIMKACAFDFFQSEIIYNAIFDFEDSESFSDEFEEAEIGGSNFILGIGPVFIFIVYQVVYQMIYYSTRLATRGREIKSKRLSNFVEPRNFIQIWIVFILEGCVEMGIMVGVCFKKFNDDRISNFSETFSTVLCGIMAVALIIAPIYMLVVGNRLYKAKVDGQRATVKHYESLFEGKRLRNWYAIQHTLLFFIRRYCLMAAIVFFPEGRFAQTFLQIHFTVLMICYTMTQKPFEDPNMNRQEIINEFTILTASYLLYLYTEFVWEAETRYMIGWIHILILCINLVINVSFMVYASTYMWRLKLKKKYILKQYEKTKHLKMEEQQKKIDEEQRKKNELLEMFPDLHSVIYERTNEEDDDSLESHSDHGDAAQVNPKQDYDGPRYEVPSQVSQDESNIFQHPSIDELIADKPSKIAVKVDKSVVNNKNETSRLITAKTKQTASKQEAQKPPLYSQTQSVNNQQTKSVVSSKKGKAKKNRRKSKRVTQENFKSSQKLLADDPALAQAASEQQKEDEEKKFDKLVEEAIKYIDDLPPEPEPVKLDIDKLIPPIQFHKEQQNPFYSSPSIASQSPERTYRESQRVGLPSEAKMMMASSPLQSFRYEGIDAASAAAQSQRASEIAAYQRQVVHESQRRNNRFEDPIGLIPPSLMRQNNSVALTGRRTLKDSVIQPNNDYLSARRAVSLMRGPEPLASYQLANQYDQGQLLLNRQDPSSFNIAPIAIGTNQNSVSDYFERQNYAAAGTTGQHQQTRSYPASGRRALRIE